MAVMASGEWPADVRRPHDSGVAGKRRWNRRLALDDVEPGTRDATLAQGVDQGVRIDDRAARNVDEEAARPERFEHVGVHGVVGARAAGRCHHQHVAPGGEIDEAIEAAIRNVVLPRTAEVPDLHLEADAAPRHGLADVPEAEDAELAPGDVGQRALQLFPAALAHAVVAYRHLVHRRRAEAPTPAPLPPTHSRPRRR
jgi:hypothetical protein